MGISAAIWHFTGWVSSDLRLQQVARFGMANKLAALTMARDGTWPRLSVRSGCTTLTAALSWRPYAAVAGVAWLGFGWGSSSESLPGVRWFAA